MLIFKVIIIIIVIIAFFFIFKYQVENFNNKNYINRNEYNTNFNKIYSCLPYDIKAKNENLLIYDYGNDELNEKFSKLFNLDNTEKQIKLIEGVNWTSWTSWGLENNNFLSPVNTYYTTIINDFEKSLKNDIFNLPTSIKEIDNDFKIINKSLNRFKKGINRDYYMLDIDIIIYRDHKPLARHIKIIGVCSPLKTEYLMVKVIGVINQDGLFKNKIKSATDNNNYSEFIPERVIVYDNNSFIYDMDDRRANSQVSYNLYNKLLKDLTS